MASVTYIFSNVPGGTSIPLSELDYNFSECINNTNFTAANISGNLAVTGSSTFTGPVTVNNFAIGSGGVLTIGANSVVPSGITGAGQMVFNNSPTLIAPILGTPTSGTLTNCTGLPVGGLSNLGAGVADFLTTPSSSNLRTAVLGSTGTGILVFNTNPILISPDLGTPTTGVLTNCTGYNAANLTGNIPIAQGGTGATTAQGAINNLLPSQAGQAGKVLTTNGATTSWATNASGSVSSVALSGGTTGLTVNGSPITTSGTFTLGGTVSISAGGTGATSRQAALNTLAGGAGANLFLVGDGTNIVLASLTPAQIAAAGTLSNNTTGSAATFSSTIQNSQFNSIGVNTAPTGVAGQISAGLVTANTFTNPSGTLNPSVLMPMQVGTGQAQLSFSGIPDWATEITINFNFLNNTGAVDWLVQIGNSVPATAGYGANSQVPTVRVTTSTSGFIIAANNANLSMSGTMILTKLSGNAWISTSTLSWFSVSPYVSIGNGSIVLPGPLTVVSINANGGTFSSGSASVIYR